MPTHPGELAPIGDQRIRDCCLVGTAEAMIEQIRALEADGLENLFSPQAPTT